MYSFFKCILIIIYFILIQGCALFMLEFEKIFLLHFDNDPLDVTMHYHSSGPIVGYISFPISELAGFFSYIRVMIY